MSMHNTCSVCDSLLRLGSAQESALRQFGFCVISWSSLSVDEYLKISGGILISNATDTTTYRVRMVSHQRSNDPSVSIVVLQILL